MKNFYDIQKGVNSKNSEVWPNEIIKLYWNGMKYFFILPEMLQNFFNML